ncbi:MAG: hypothetical protein LBB11_02810 [Puniceicoccales bacterium]|jgi:hypothetical protein|nr:hypothetical protein [Puniceicoccales bacterium]
MWRVSSVSGNILWLWGLVLLSGCQTAKKEFPKSNFHFFIESNEGAPYELWSATATMIISGLKFPICSCPAILASDVDWAQITTSNFGQCILFKLTQRASVELYKLSTVCIGRRIIFAFDGQALGLSMPMSAAITDGTLIIFPEVEEEKLASLVDKINDIVTKLKKLKKD